MYKHLLQFIFCFLIALYIGEDRGQFVAGMNAEVGDTWKIKSDVRSYITAWTGKHFAPDKVLYKLEVGSDNINLRHECFHGVDKPNPDRYNKTVLSVGTIF